MIALLVSCGSKEEKKKGFEYNRTQKEIKKSSVSSGSAVPIDMDNKGIGPIASVDFSNIASIAMESGFNVSGYTTQSMFLISLGIDSYLKNEQNEDKKLKIAQEIKQLVLPGTMGEVFKVMALSKKQSVKLEGFKELDLTHRL